MLAVNLSGAFFMSQAALHHMGERGTGRIVNISSVIGSTGNIGQANYAASKSGLFGLTYTLAKEAAFILKRAGKLGDPIGLTVNTVTPGFIADRDARVGAGEGARPASRTRSRSAASASRGGRARRALPVLRQRRLHHRPGLGRQRRARHVSELGEIIRRQRELNRLSMRQFAQLAGISNPYLSQIERGLREPSERVVESIARSLETTAEALYEEAGLVAEEDAEPAAVPTRDRRRSRRSRRASARSCWRCTTPSSPRELVRTRRRRHRSRAAPGAAER